tara:strand:+ start:590 stop:949 length:360 start_codon:yes stop_codon:yes gene_type:complete
MKKLFFFIIILISVSSIVLAAEEAGGIQFSNVLLTIAILIGIASSVYAFLPSIKMKGGTIGAGLRFYSFGMLAVVVSLLSVTWLKTTLGGIAGTIHDLFFIIGFLLIAFGTKKILDSFK